ncbi:Uma2 family endonuclease [Nonomuraea sp. NPDC055795]
MAKLLERPAVASPPPLSAKYRAACQLFPDDRVELIRGRIVVNDVPTWKHNKIVSRLLKQIVAKAAEEEWELGTNTKLFLGAQKDRYIPDLTVAPAEPRMWGDDEIHAGDTLLVVEVVSPSSVHDDYAIKPKEYAIAGVQAFLRIDPMEATASIHSRPAPDGYTIVVTVALGNPLEMPAPWNLTLDTAQLNVAESSG